MKVLTAALVGAIAMGGLAACSSQPSDCVEMSTSRVKLILGDGATPMKWGAVESAAKPGSYYVFIQFRAEGYTGDGFWLSHGLDTGGAESLDAGAEAWSGLPRSTVYDSFDTRADDAKRCAG